MVFVPAPQRCRDPGMNIKVVLEKFKPCTPISVGERPGIPEKTLIRQEWQDRHMSVLVKFQSPTGLVFLDLDKISVFQITRQRSTCEIIAITPENPHPQMPYSIARRDQEWKLREILDALQQLKAEKKEDIIFEITDTEVHLIKKL